MSSDTELAYVSTDDLIDELANRHDFIVICGLPKADQPNDGGSTARFVWRGNYYSCLGLVEQMAHDLKAGE